MDNHLANVEWDTPEAAEAGFYRALEQSDLTTMMTVWDRSETIVCIHPMGPRLQGRIQVCESWREIFRSANKLQFDVNLLQHIVHGDVAIHHVQETIVVLNDQSQSAVVSATNVYRRGRQGWRMLVHHASPVPAPSAKNQPLH